MSDHTSDHPEFLEMVTAFQPRLYGYLLVLTGQPTLAQELLQESNLVIWKKAAEFQLGSNFKAWSFRIAHFQFLSYQQKQIRDRIVFDDQLISTLQLEAEQADEQTPYWQRRLHHCLEKLPQRQREILISRYLENATIDQLAEQSGRTSNAVTQLLHRARQGLRTCLELRTLTSTGDS